METSDVIVVESYLNVKKFMDKFQLHDYKDLSVKINRIEKLTPVYDLHFEEYDVDIEMTPLTFKFYIIVSEFEKENNVRKLKVDVREELFRPELQSCFNHLRRKRNVNYAVELLLYFTYLFQQRAKLMDYCVQRASECLTMDYVEEKGFIMQCSDPVTKETYFHAKWKIWWNCRNLNFYDYIDFAVNKSFAEFHIKVKTIMVDLLVPKDDYDVKHRAWSKIFDYVDEINSINLLTNSIRDLHVESGNMDNYDILAAPIEISDSESDDDDDDDDCVIEGTSNVWQFDCRILAV